MPAPRTPPAAPSIPQAPGADLAPVRVRLNGHGQITIPQPLRARLKLQHGDTLEVRCVAECLLQIRVLHQSEAPRRKDKAALPTRPLLAQLPQGFALTLDSFLGDLRESAAKAVKRSRG